MSKTQRSTMLRLAVTTEPADDDAPEPEATPTPRPRRPSPPLLRSGRVTELGVEQGETVRFAARASEDGEPIAELKVAP